MNLMFTFSLFQSTPKWPRWLNRRLEVLPLELPFQLTTCPTAPTAATSNTEPTLVPDGAAVRLNNLFTCYLLNFLIGLTPASFSFIFTIQIYHTIMTVELTYVKNRVEMVCWDSNPGFRMKGAGESTGLWALKNLKID